MSKTFTQIYFHVVFSVKYRRNSISKNIKKDLYNYISGIITNKNQKLIIINGTSDHVHLLIGAKPDCNLSELIRDVKSNSSKWINQFNKTFQKFEWQEGFGAFTVGHSAKDIVYNYIVNQEEHHKKITFEIEYLKFLEKNQILFDEKYVFDKQ